MYLADYHTHSAASPDGSLTVNQLAEAAVRAGLDEICVTDHVDTVLWGSHAPREHFDWTGLLAQVPQAREQYAGRLTIRLGAELGEAPMIGLCHRFCTHGWRKIPSFRPVLH